MNSLERRVAVGLRCAKNAWAVSLKPSARSDCGDAHWAYTPLLRWSFSEG